jgi:pimeloyl-ACP methyl ester carboxylesterase
MPCGVGRMAVVRTPTELEAASAPPVQTTREQTRAREPDEVGIVERDGVRISWERYGDGSPTILLLPTWSIIHSRHWKAQIPYLARLFRVVTFDGRGNGRSDRPLDPQSYTGETFLEDAIAVLDATGTDRAVAVGLSMGGGHVLRLAATHPERLLGAVFIGASVDVGTPPDPDLAREHLPFDRPLDRDDGWAKYNEHYWRRDWAGFAEFFFRQVFNEPHSTKQIEDAVAWTLETDPEVIIAGERVDYMDPPESFGADPLLPTGLAFAPRVRCPCLVIHGDRDVIVGPVVGQRLAELLGARLVMLRGGGHAPTGRDPVKVNLLIREFVDGLETVP